MDQNACSSPQIVFWQNAKNETKKVFWDAVVANASQRYDLQPAVVIDKYVQLCRDAITYDNLSSIRQEGLLYRESFSILPSGDLTGLRGKGGYFYEYDLQNLDELAPIITEKYQTATYYGMSPETLREFVMRHHLRGIDRIVPIGSAMDIGVIWDGYDLINMLSRIVSVL
jgi:hypothetical protein